MIDPYDSFLFAGLPEQPRGNGPREPLPRGLEPSEGTAPGVRLVDGVQLVNEIDRCTICGGDGICETCSGAGFVDGERCPDCDGRSECRACDGDG